MQRKTLMQLFIPIAFETLFFMLAGMVDTLMLSSVGDAAVGAVGTANTYISIFIMMFNVVSSGMIAVMTQYIGAERVGVAYQAKQLGSLFNAILGIGLSLILFFFTGNILDIVGVAPLLMEHAKTYLQIVGSFCFLNALTPIFSSYLRAFGHAKPAMIAAVVANIVNLALNAVFLFVCNWGVAGVAAATVISRVVNLAIVVIAGHILVQAKEDPDRISNKEVFTKIVKIGLPSAAETMMYNIALTLTIRFLNQMDPEGINVTARSYAAQITNFSYCIGLALAVANAIMTGWRIGAKEYEECSRQTKKVAIIGILIGAAVETVLAFSAPVLVGFFTKEPEMIALVQKLLFIDIILECGRCANLIFVQSLKTSGDALFTTIMAVIFSFICMAGGTWFFGIHLEMMAVGAYIAMALDECVRGVCMFLRWQSGKWRGKSLVHN